MITAVLILMIITLVEYIKITNETERKVIAELRLQEKIEIKRQEFEEYKVYIENLSFEDINNNEIETTKTTIKKINSKFYEIKKEPQKIKVNKNNLRDSLKDYTVDEILVAFY